MSPGRKAAKLRRRLQIQEAERAVAAPLRKAGHSCADCSNRTKVVGIGQTCDLDSDFHGYARVQMDHVCSRWRLRPPPENNSGLLAERVVTRIFPVYIDAIHYRVTLSNERPIAVEQVLTLGATEILCTGGAMSPTVRAVMEVAGIVAANKGHA